MPEPLRIGPFAFPGKARGNKHLGGRTTAHWSGEASLAKEQREIVAAAFKGTCSGCGALPTAVRGTLGWLVKETCSCRRPLRPHQLPPHGFDDPVDIMLIRVPSHGGSYLDSHDGWPHAAKAVADEVALQLWPKGPDGKPISKVDDSAPWLRWEYGQRPHRKTKSPRRMTKRADWVPGPADPPNKGTELCEIIIAPREDCRCRCQEPLQDLIAAWEKRQQNDPRWDAPKIVLANLRQVAEWGKRCGCGRSTLPDRWLRGLV